MEKILKQLFNSTLSKSNQSAITGSNTHRPIAKAVSLFNKPKQAKATSSLKNSFKKATISAGIDVESTNRQLKIWLSANEPQESFFYTHGVK